MKSIIIYYSFGGNTKAVAEQIQKETGADIAEIKTVKPYTGSYNDVVEQGHKEVNEGYMPEILPLNINLSDYQIVILGTPVWWYTFAPAMKTFLNDTDWQGKTVYPFATNGGWLGHTFKDFENVCKGAVVKSGLNIRFNQDRMLSSEAEIKKWMEGIGRTE